MLHPDASLSGVLGNKLTDILTTISDLLLDIKKKISDYSNHTHTVPNGVSGPPILIPNVGIYAMLLQKYNNIKQKIRQILSKIVKLK